MTDSSGVASAGRSLVTWLTVLQALGVAGGVASLVLSFGPAAAGLPRGFTLGLAAFQLLVAAVTVLVLQLAKTWLTNTRVWATGEAPANAELARRHDRTLSGWLVFGQWFPVVALPILAALAWYAMGRALDPAILEQAGATLPEGVTFEQVAGLAQVGVLLSFAAFGLPALIINFSVLGWIRRWMNGVTDAVVGQGERETRLPELAGTLARWFTFFQALLGLLALFILIVPLLPTQEGVNAGLGDRLNLLLSFLQIALFIALLTWSKTFLLGVTRRATGQASR